MIRTFVALATIVTALGAAAGANAATKLTGTVGPDSSFAISLKQGTKKVTKLKAGKYTIVIKDTAAIHNFHLTGPGLNKTTPVTGKGTFTWAVTLKKGTYKYVCDPHKTVMKGSFTVS
ncbi:MAG TPA: plastocyanin/azurin family copper-binding protein [Gaiellaceae bacterium]|jgi:plastocyanin